MKFNEIKTYLDELYPEYLKASYDNVGLMVGSLNKEIKTILLALDLTREVMDEAISIKADLIITHHPILFKPIYSLNVDNDPGSIIRDLIKYDIVNFSLHTNFDSVKMNDYLADLLKLNNKEVLSVKENIGVVGEIETIKAKDYIKKVLKAFNVDKALYYGDSDKEIKKIAIVGGSGSSMLYDCLNKNVDLFITGDSTYSRGLEAKRMNIGLLDVGHYIEFLYTNVIKEDLLILDKNLNVNISKIDPIPFTIYEAK